MNAPLRTPELRPVPQPCSLVYQYDRHVPRPVRRLVARATPDGARRHVKDWLILANVGNRRRRRRILRRRRPLLVSDRSVREFHRQGRVLLGREVREFSGAAAAARNLELVVVALDRAGVSRFLVPGESPFRYVVGVRAADREAALAELQELYRDTPLYVGVPRRNGSVAHLHFLVDGPWPDEVAAADVLRFGELLVGPGDQLLGNTRSGCDLEFWAEDGRLTDGTDAQLLKGAALDVLADSLIAPRRNAVSGYVPATEQVPAHVTVRGRDHLTFRPFALPRVSEVRFPIDVVYTWVDGDDPGLKAKRARYRPEPEQADGPAAKASRFASHDELRYSLRSLEMYADFVRHVYLVTDDQVPDWLNAQAPGLTVVDHKEIFTDPGVLPVFNSHALSTQLHHIDGLSEHYLYLNDDILLGRPVTADRFFHANGIARIPFS